MSIYTTRTRRLSYRYITLYHTLSIPLRFTKKRLLNELRKTGILDETTKEKEEVLSSSEETK